MIIDCDKCPNCNTKLKFDVHTGKKHCPHCGKIWSFEYKVDQGKIKAIVREWKMIELEP